MPRRRTRLNWHYDNDLQQFTTAAGQTVTLLQIAQLLQDQVTCTHDLTGAWSGWRIRQNRLIAPGQTFNTRRITTTNLRAFSRWLRSFEGEQAQLEFGTGPTDRAEPLQATHDRTPPSPTRRRDSDSAKSQEQPPNQKAAQQEPQYEPRRRAEVI